jgi:Sec7-like guanine-nucleotide exchange factor
MGLGIWSTAESGTYLVAACLPSLRSFLKPVKNAFGIRSMSTRYSHSAYTLNDTSDPFAEHLPREPQTAFHSPSGSLDRGELDCTEVQRAECRWYSEGSSQNPGVQSEDEGNEVRVQRSRSFPSETDIRISE